MKKFFAAALSLALLFLPQTAKAETVVFTDTCTSNPAVNLDSSTSITVGTSWSARITLDGSPTSNVTNGTASCSPAAGETNLGYGYTMSPDASTNIYFVDFFWNDGGAVSANSAQGMIVNYIDSSNYYACVTNDDASGAVDAYIVKMSTGGNSTLASAVDIARTLDNDFLQCWIDYSGANPVLSFRDTSENAYLIASTTDSSSPLTQDGTGGVVVGATPARTNDDSAAALDFDDVRLVDVGTAGVSAPTVSTDDITPGVISATLLGSVSATGGENVTPRGFAWGTSSTLQDSGVFATTSETAGGPFGTGQFSQGVSGIFSGITYYYRAYATNSGGTGYGTIKSFTPGSDTTPSRKMRLFEGFTIRILEGGRLLINQQ